MNYHIIKEMTENEEIDIYMSLPKETLVEMIIECNRVISNLPIRYIVENKIKYECKN